MGDLPLIPGYSFNHCAVRSHKMKNKLNYSNGCRIVCDSNDGLAKRPADSSSCAYAQEIPDEVIYDPTLTYGRTSSYPYRQVIPHYVLYAQKCLKFKSFFRQSVFNSPLEYHRVRHVNIIYFLEDDTMCIVEPPVDNAGLVQGRLVSRAKIPKNQDGQYYHWKDLNVGIDIEIYGRVYHTLSCDLFTREFLRSQGIDVNDEEEAPPDSYIQTRLAKEAAIQAAMAASKRSRSGSLDSRRRFLEYTGMVLTFEAIWNEDNYHVMYFLTDDTIVVKEIDGSNKGKDPHRVFLRRMKVPKNWTDMPNKFPSIYLERGDEEVVEYYAPIDLRVGQTMFIFGRRFLLCDCDAFTRKYYSQMLNIEQPQSIVPANSKPPSQHRISNQSRPKTCPERNDISKVKNTIRSMFNHPNRLRYLASMVAVHPEDEGRDFVLEYNLSDGKIKINEIGRRNSGHRAGCFLSYMHVPKPRKTNNDCDADDNKADDNISYYSPEDFFIGAQINAFNHRFIIKDADHFVFQYIKANSDHFPPDLVENLMNHFNKPTIIAEKVVDHSHESDKKMREPILPVTPRTNLPVLVPQNISLNSPDEKICNYNRKMKDEFSPSPRKITWADQVQIPCRL